MRRVGEDEEVRKETARGEQDGWTREEGKRKNPGRGKERKGMKGTNVEEIEVKGNKQKEKDNKR